MQPLRSRSHPARRWHGLRRLGAIAGLLVVAGAASAALKEGDAAPDFQAPAARAGQPLQVSLKQARASGPVVVYFYPAAFTEGCSIQAHAFAQRQAQFKAAGATVLGLSLDPIEKLRAFSADPASCAGQVTVASDADGRIAAAYQLSVRAPEAGKLDRRGEPVTHGRVERTTFVVAPDGTVAASIGGVSPEQNVEQALAAVQRLQARQQGAR